MKPKAKQEDTAAELDRLDPLLHHRVRLGAMVLLANGGRLSFVRLRELLGGTDGNTGAQLRTLEDGGYIQSAREFVGRRPVTWYSITPPGKRALHTHLEALQRMLKEIQPE